MNKLPGPISAGQWPSARGSAVIMAMLIMLVLSAMGVIAMRSVTESVWQSGNHRTRNQAMLFADAVANLAAVRAGNNANAYIGMLRESTSRDLTAARALGAAGTGLAQSSLRRGGFQIFSPTGSKPNEASLQSLFEGNAGMFTNDKATRGSFESDVAMPTDFRFIVRDPIDGPPAPGYSSRYCFKKVSIASEVRIGKDDAGQKWDSRSNRASSRNLLEALIGPVDCGSG